MSNKQKVILLSLGITVVAGGAGFLGGVQYQKSHTKTTIQSARGGGLPNLSPQVQQQLQSATTPQERQAILQKNGVTGFGRGGRLGGATTGQVIAKDDKTMTVKTSDGSTHIIYYDTTTTVNTQATGTLSDVVIGKTVSINGTTNSDSSVTATKVTVQP